MTPGRPERGVAQPFRLVAIPAAVALGAIGAIAAERAAWPAVVGVAGGALAAVLTVMALPSVPTRRATVLLLGIGGLGALRHAPATAPHASVLLVVWASATLMTLLMVDRADAETTPVMAGARPGMSPLIATARHALAIAVVVAVATVALVPFIADRLGRRSWPGALPNPGSVFDAPSSLRASDTLDMRTRPRLTDRVVFTVDAPRPELWRGETFDTWDGREWSRADPSGPYALPRAGEDVLVPAPADDPGAAIGVETRQTFRLETDFSDVLFAAPSARVVRTDKFLVGRPDGSVLAANAFGQGSIYTVTSRSLLVTASDLRATSDNVVPDSVLEHDMQIPSSTSARIRALAATITAGAPTNYDKIRAIEAWLGANTRYSLNAPLSPSNVDIVDDFLFRSRLGWCEQIASSLVVLARSVGIPARLASGFAPGDRDLLTGRFTVRERDAHAWAEIYFPGVGWQGFDPTASVPLSGDAKPSGSWIQSARSHALVFGVVAALIVVIVARAPALRARVKRRRRSRATWGARALARLERAGRRAGRRRAPAETLREYANALADHLGDPRIAALGDVVDTDAFSATGAPAQARVAAEAVLSSL